MEQSCRKIQAEIGFNRFVTIIFKIGVDFLVKMGKIRNMLALKLSEC